MAAPRDDLQTAAIRGIALALTRTDDDRPARKNGVFVGRDERRREARSAFVRGVEASATRLSVLLACTTTRAQVLQAGGVPTENEAHKLATAMRAKRVALRDAVAPFVDEAAAP